MFRLLVSELRPEHICTSQVYYRHLALRESFNGLFTLHAPQVTQMDILIIPASAATLFLYISLAHLMRSLSNNSNRLIDPINFSTQ
jgi:hypothetical protein